MDPVRIDVRGTVDCGRDVVLDVNVVLSGNNTFGDGGDPRLQRGQNAEDRR